MVVILIGAAKLAQVAAYNIKKENKRHEIITAVSGSSAKKDWWDESKGVVPKSSSTSQVSSADASSSRKIGAWSRDPGPSRVPESVVNVDAIPSIPMPEKKPHVRETAFCSAGRAEPSTFVRSHQSQENLIQSTPSAPSSTSSHSSNIREEPSAVTQFVPERDDSYLLAPKTGDEQQDSVIPVVPTAPQSAFADTCTTKRYMRPAIPRATNMSCTADRSKLIADSISKTHAVCGVPARSMAPEKMTSAGTSQSALPGTAVKAKYTKLSRPSAPTQNLPREPVDLHNPKGLDVGPSKISGQSSTVVVQSSLASAGSMKRPVRTGKRVTESSTEAKTPMRSVSKPEVESALPPASSAKMLPVESSFAVPGALKRRHHRPNSSRL